MAGLWERLFRRVRWAPLKLGFTLDMDAEGRQPCSDRQDLRRPSRRSHRRAASFALRLSRGIAPSLIFYVISEADWQTLQSVRSLNPEFGQDGTLVFNVLPPVLSYLRQKENIKRSLPRRR